MRRTSAAPSSHLASKKGPATPKRTNGLRGGVLPGSSALLQALKYLQAPGKHLRLFTKCWSPEIASPARAIGSPSSQAISKNKTSCSSSASSVVPMGPTKSKVMRWKRATAYSYFAKLCLPMIWCRRGPISARSARRSACDSPRRTIRCLGAIIWAPNSAAPTSGASCREWGALI